MMSSPMKETNMQNSNFASAAPTFNAPHAAQQWNGPSVPTVYAIPASQQATVIPQFAHSTHFHQTFLKGKPKALGIVLIVAAVLNIALGIACAYTTISISFVSGITFWGPLFYIIAGSFTLVAQSKPNICMVKGSLGLNILTSIFSSVGLILVCMDLIIISATNYYDYEIYIQGTRAGGCFVLVVLLLTNLLLFSVSISVSVFGCRALGHEHNAAPQMFVIQNDVVVSMPQPPPYMIQADAKGPTWQ